ncbi:MAG: hypothetical protein AB7V27_16455 [Candidatus Binatia bacterium]
MPNEAPLVEVDIARLSRAEWVRLTWRVLVGASRYNLPPLLVIVVIVAVFGAIVAFIAYTAGLSAETIEEYELVFDVTGDLLSAAMGVYVFARSVRTLPNLALGPYRFALVKRDEPAPDPTSGRKREHRGSRTGESVSDAPRSTTGGAADRPDGYDR